MVQNPFVVHQPEKALRKQSLIDSLISDMRQSYSSLARITFLIGFEPFHVWFEPYTGRVVHTNRGLREPYQRRWTRGHIIGQKWCHWPEYRSKAEQLRVLAMLATGF